MISTLLSFLFINIYHIYIYIYIYYTVYRSLEPEKIILGPMTITKLEGNVDVGQMDSVAINCYPEFVGSQDEQIVLVVPDTIPQDKDGKIITLSVTSSIPCIDFQNFDAMFHENYVVERIQDFDCFNDVRIEYTRIPLINRSRKRSYYTNLLRKLIQLSTMRRFESLLSIFPVDRAAHRICPPREVSLLPVHQRAEYSRSLFQIVQLRHSPREHKYRTHRRLTVTR